MSGIPDWFVSSKFFNFPASDGDASIPGVDFDSDRNLQTDFNWRFLGLPTTLHQRVSPSILMTIQWQWVLPNIAMAQ